MACSMPPMYWSTGSQRFTSAESKIFVSSCGVMKRQKYHDESTKVSIVSVSRRAAPPHFGHFVFTNSGVAASGDSPIPVSFGFGGSSTGKSLSGTGTSPSFAQYTTGIGVPQYRCREIPQSFKRNTVSRFPNPFVSASAVIFSIAAAESNPLYGPEFTERPYSVYGSFKLASFSGSPETG